MKRIIETRKGRFVVKYYETWSELIIDANFYKLKLGVSIFKISEITEEEASEIVDLFQLQYHKYKRIYQLYNLENINQKLNHTFSAIESLHSLLKSQGIEITNNTYIFKVN